MLALGGAMDSELEAVAVGVLAIGLLAAGGLEAWLVRSNHPRRWTYAWLAWTPLAMLFLGAVVSAGGGSLVVALAVALVGGPLAYPVYGAMARHYVRRHQPARQEIWDDLQRARYRPTDFGANAEEAQSAAPPPPPPLRGPPLP